MRLSEKTALITGAGQGIGKEFARAYIAEGAKVAIADIDFGRAAKTAEDLGERAIAVHLDVCSQKSIDDAVSKVIAEYGFIDILVNNAAIFDLAALGNRNRSMANSRSQK
ncbi:hypothetical protein CPY51_15800 [Rhizobium tubonense]|uniref:Uncharacterized protein n=1 Tax=Rhizobium tubonense TaxID=484088 RepID=A0A2W4CIY0_9HYPH|nr:hypothetical protein CPY51_15800 [Rhizobium tubonense]